MATRLKTVRLACDTCGCVRQGKLRQSLAALRLQLRGKGWTTEGDVDTCQACVVGAAPTTELRAVR